MRVVDEPIQNGIAKRGVADQLMPVLHGDLTGDEGGPSPGPVLDDLQQIAALPISQRGQAPVVKL